jgi:hypothetical protein
MMDAIVFNTEDFTITVRSDGKITTQLTLEEDMVYQIVDITDTSLGKLLWAACREKFAQQGE